PPPIPDGSPVMPGVSESTVTPTPTPAVLNAPSTGAPVLSRRVLGRGATLGALFLAELLALTIHFDGEALLASPPWGPRHLVWAALLPPGLLTSSAVSLPTVSPRLKPLARSLVDQAAGHRWTPWLGLHFVAVAVLWQSTASLFEGGSESIALVMTWTL